MAGAERSPVGSLKRLLVSTSYLERKCGLTHRHLPRTSRQCPLTTVGLLDDLLRRRLPTIAASRFSISGTTHRIARTLRPPFQRLPNGAKEGAILVTAERLALYEARKVR